MQHPVTKKKKLIKYLEDAAPLFKKILNELKQK